MGEAKRRKLAGNTTPDPNYKRKNRFTRKDEAEAIEKIIGNMFGTRMLLDHNKIDAASMYGKFGGK